MQVASKCLSALLLHVVLLTLPNDASGEETAWQRHTIDDSSRGADGVRLADFNDDGRMDIVTGWEEGGITRVYLQPDSSEVRKPWPAVTAGKTPNVEDAVAADLDGDGRLDVVSSTEGKTRTLFVHWGPESNNSFLDTSAWQTQPLPASIGTQAWMFCLPMQVDNRRGIDLVVGSKGKNAAVGWWESPENPRRLEDWKYHRWIDAGWIMSLLSDDVDGDGDQDVIVSDRKGSTRGVKWLENPGMTSTKDTHTPWTTHSISGEDKEWMFANVADVDADGANDVIVATWAGTIDIFHRDHSTNSPRWRQHEIANPFGYQQGKSVLVADFNRDGREDIAATFRSRPVDHPAVTLIQYLGDSPLTPNWQATDIGGPEGSKFDLLEAIDIDGDGDLDLISCEEVSNLGVFWYENPHLPGSAP